MKNYKVTDRTIQDEAVDAGVDVNAFGQPDDGPDPADTSSVKEQPVRFDSSIPAWNFPSGEGYLCEMITSETNARNTPIPFPEEDWDDLAQ
jgi:hypothetical protein